MSSALHVVRAGTGPAVVLVHGSAADHTTWSIQLASRALTERFSLVAYDRRVDRTTVEEHADDAAALLGDAPALVVGSSFGAVVALELVRRHGARCAGAILIEPPMSPTEDVTPEQRALLGAFDQRLAEQGGPAAAELFLRAVLGDAAYERMPRAFQDRARAKWAAIRADAAALVAYRPRYAELAAVRVPVRLLGGERSAPYFRQTLAALAAALPEAQTEILPAGHMLHAEAHRRFAEIVIGLADAVGHPRG